MTQRSEVPSEARLLALIDAMAGQQVVMAVDLVLDRYILGTPKRISREAPVLILAHEGERSVPGGGANAVANVAALDGRPLPIGVVGDDPCGAELLAHFRALGVPLDAVVTRRGYRTPTKTRVLAGARHSLKQQVVRFDVEDTVELGEADLAQMVAGVPADSTLAVLSDYGYGGVVPALAAALRMRLGRGATLLCDSRYRLAEFHDLDGATPNLEEAEALLGERFPEEIDALAAAGGRARARLGARFLLVTRGSRGMSLFSAEGSAHLPVHGTDQVADVTGAGDTVIGTFALAMAAGASPVEATVLANYAGGVVVQKMGTATLTRDELRLAVRTDPHPREALRWVAS